MCGVVGMLACSPVNQLLFDALSVLQHRGQDAAGMMTSHEGRLFLHKGNGLVRDVFRTRHMRRLKGNMGIGHVRYPTAGSSSESEAQPFYVNSPYGISLVHNGNLTNADSLKQELYHSDFRHLNTGSDSEVILNVLAHELQSRSQLRPEVQDFFEAVSRVHDRCRGAYAVVAMISGYGLIGFRDPNGIRPLVYGVKNTLQGKEYMFASESAALENLGFTRVADVKPGEAILITTDHQIFKQSCAAPAPHTPCIFEYVYLSRSDTTIEDVSVYQARLRMGEKLADKIARTWDVNNIDVVIPVPETSRTSAIPLANRLGVDFREGFVKNRYIGRTFIMPEQETRKRSVRQKLNVIPQEFKNKNVLLIDDSIVRGTTSREIIQMARDAGAQKVYFASAAPPVRHPNVYGIDMPSHEELIAHQQDADAIAFSLGADGLIFQDLEDLNAAISEINPKLTQFETSIFDGQYITQDVDASYLNKIAQRFHQTAERDLETNVEMVQVDL